MLYFEGGAEISKDDAWRNDVLGRGQPGTNPNVKQVEVCLGCLKHKEASRLRAE